MNGGNDARADGHGRVYQASGDQYIIEHHHHAPEWSGPDSVRHPAVGRPPVVLRDRTVEMERLRATVGPGVGNGVYVLHGLGGCGKTAVAYTLFQHATRHAGRAGLWVNASDPASLRAGMLAVAADRGAGDAELAGAQAGLRPAADLVWEYLDRSEQPWLLVLDNADTPAVLRDGGWLRTSPCGVVLVTTRQAARRWWPGAELLQFGVLPREDAARVLQDLAPDAGSLEEAAEVADRLGRLPLALTLAGGFLAHQVIDPWTLADYRHRLDEGDTGAHPIELLDQGAEPGSDSRRLLSGTWQLSLDALTAQGLPEATTLLRLLTCWASDPLPVKVLAGAAIEPGLHPSRVESALRGLLDHSLTDLLTGEVRGLRTHGILLDSVARTVPDEERERLAATAAGLLAAVLPEVPERGAQDPAVIQLTPHVMALLRRVTGRRAGRSVVEAAADRAVRLVTAVHRSGDYASALSLAEEALGLCVPALGADNVFVVRLRQRAARAVFRLGRFEESEALYRRLLEDCERALGPDAPDTLETCLRLALPLFVRGRTQDAIPLAKRAVRGREESLGASHPLSLLARVILLELAAAPELAGLPERDELIATGPALIADCHAALGPEHPVTLGAELNHAYVLNSVGRAEEALPPIRHALAVYGARLTEQHPWALSARRTFAIALGLLGRYDEAIPTMETVVEGRVRMLGPTHPWTLEDEETLAGYRSRRRPSC
ncbi:tetratricopeptide repeat protein [Streptomyces abyssomicinicus]|uniref:tetratricopeptide repeat protein n=1 Tax=Streptomyces abyssomicinicus TaxID=574929 RepID=UPI00124F8D62|nr:tetratricopeptide repeat protein [Streptomyces abyssomicinicus]